MICENCHARYRKEEGACPKCGTPSPVDSVTLDDVQQAAQQASQKAAVLQETVNAAPAAVAQAVQEAVAPVAVMDRPAAVGSTCHVCGKVLPAGTVFCNNCGAPVTAAPAPASVAAPTYTAPTPAPVAAPTYTAPAPAPVAAPVYAAPTPAPTYTSAPVPAPAPVEAAAPAPVVCTNCGNELVPGATFCNRCGAPAPAPVPVAAAAPAPVVCTNCGNELAPGATFCNRCGAPAPAPAPVVAAAPMPVVCTNCGNELAPGATFCNICGAPAPVPAPVMATGPVCIRCGNPLIPGASVCNVCGQPAPAPVKVKKPVNKKAVKRAIIAAAIIVALIGATFGGIFISKVVRYNNAANMMEAGDYAGAQEIFTNLEDYKDASTQADICGNFIVYNEAQALMDQGDYETALEKFQSLGSFEDASAKADECQNNIDYKNATRYYSDGQYYKAYSLFSGLPAGFKDAAEMAENCIQPMPSVSKVLYLNPAYSEAAAGLEVTDTCSSDFYRCIRIYTQGGELVSSAFLRPGESVFLIFSPGTYTIKIGVGEMWFGDEDTFGAQGKYGILPGLNTDLSLTFEYNEAWTYTLSDYNTGSDGNSRLPISYGNF